MISVQIQYHDNYIQKQFKCMPRAGDYIYIDSLEDQLNLSSNLNGGDLLVTKVLLYPSDPDLGYVDAIVTVAQINA